MKAKRILMVLTSHEDLGISGKKTGNWFDELATPYYKFKEARLDVSITSPKGGPVPIDPFSYEEAFMSDSARRLAADATAQRALTMHCALPTSMSTTMRVCSFLAVMASSGTLLATRGLSAPSNAGLPRKSQWPWSAMLRQFCETRRSPMANLWSRT